MFNRPVIRESNDREFIEAILSFAAGSPCHDHLPKLEQPILSPTQRHLAFHSRLAGQCGFRFGVKRVINNPDLASYSHQRIIRKLLHNRLNRSRNRSCRSYLAACIHQILSRGVAPRRGSLENLREVHEVTALHLRTQPIKVETSRDPIEQFRPIGHLNFTVCARTDYKGCLGSEHACSLAPVAAEKGFSPFRPTMVKIVLAL